MHPLNPRVAQGRPSSAWATAAACETPRPSPEPFPPSFPARLPCPRRRGAGGGHHALTLRMVPGRAGPGSGERCTGRAGGLWRRAAGEPRCPRPHTRAPRPASGLRPPRGRGTTSGDLPAPGPSRMGASPTPQAASPHLSAPGGAGSRCLRSPPARSGRMWELSVWPTLRGTKFQEQERVGGGLRWEISPPCRSLRSPRWEEGPLVSRPYLLESATVQCQS